jgi:hypothetical protein
MSEITINQVTNEVTAWTKEISFDREGETYIATLFWDIQEGYDLVFRNPSLFKPAWAFTEYKLLGELEQLLDEMTEREAANA